MLFTDIEGSTRLWEKDRESMSLSLKTHDVLLSAAVTSAGGSIIKHTGDGVFAVLPAGASILPGLVDLHRILSSTSAELPTALRLRMGLHCGQAEERSGDLFGPDVGLTQRVMDSCAGGQILLTSEAAANIPLPAGSSLVDLGIQRLRDLGEPRRLHLLRHPGLPGTDRISPRTLSSVPNNLLRPLTPFVGRSREMLELRRLLANEDLRLMTITGPGGTGKSRLALHVAAEASIHFPDGVYLAQLSGLTSIDQLAPVLASAIGLEVSSSGDPGRMLIEYFHTRRILLILDNYDHFLPDIGFIERILDSGQGMKLIVTSRERLHSAAESLIRLSGLSSGLSGQAGEGERLFIETAERMGGGSISPADLSSISTICTKLHGNPLAIILASSWGSVLTPGEILEELRGSAPLRANIIGLPTRHSSLREVFMFSWRLLDGKGQRNLCLLSFFRGSFTREDALAVTGVDLGGISELLDKSLIERLENSRFSIHPLVLDFARMLTDEGLEPGAAERVAEVYRRYFCEMLELHADGLLKGDRTSASKALLDSMDNIREGWRTSILMRDCDSIRSACHGMFALLGHMGAYQEGWDLFSQAVHSCVSEGGVLDPLRGWLLTYQGWFGSYCRSSSESLILLEESVNLFRGTSDRKGLAAALNNLGNSLYVSGRFSEAERVYSESLSIRRAEGDRHGVAAVLNNLGNLACEKGEYHRATEAYLESLDIDRKLGDSHGSAASLTNIAIVSMNTGDWDRASVLLKEALEIEQAIGRDFSAAIVKGFIIDVLLHGERLDEAEELIRSNQKAFDDLGSGWGAASTEHKLARLLMKRSYISEAARKLLPAVRSSLQNGWIPLTLDLLGLSANLLGRAGLVKEATDISIFIREHPSSSPGLIQELEEEALLDRDSVSTDAGDLNSISTAVDLAERGLNSICGG